jgi:uncharacterized protein with HEPN domain
MSQHDDGVRLRHMLDAAKQAIEFTRGAPARISTATPNSLSP